MPCKSGLHSGRLHHAGSWLGVFTLLFSVGVFIVQYYSDTFSPFVADRRATAWTTETLSHAAISQKNWLAWKSNLSSRKRPDS